ncbi:SDR family NAD(P)-dependent oxidoreductase [Polaromonas sp.]|uniref:SDR family NAD(P)-dependent oxidoreductase n=1 Tax=Polaromonas sp. TaxID=1869339 RepID=UPI003BA90915
MSKAKDASLQDRVIIVTGGARGLGREMALELLELGAKVIVTGATESESLNETIAIGTRLAGAGRVAGIAADVSNFQACEGVLKFALEKFGALHVLVNNAGQGMRLISETFNTKPVPFWEINPDHWRSIIGTNVNGVFNMSRACVPNMLAQGFGKVINISTSDPTMVRKGYSPYGPSKAALEAMSRVWSQDLEGTGVDVNVYLPGGAADTDLLPPSENKRGADGNLLPAAIMRRGIGWLCSNESNGHTGGRYIARLWDETLPVAQGAGIASTPGHFLAA